LAGVAVLTPKEARFARELPTADSATDAAIKAGYAPTSAHVQASRAIRKDKVVKAVAKQQAKLEKASAYTREEWEQRLKEEAEGSKTDTSSNARIAALQTLGKANGWIQERIVMVSADVARAVIQAASTTPNFEPGYVVQEGDWDRFQEAVLQASKSL